MRCGSEGEEESVKACRAFSSSDVCVLGPGMGVVRPPARTEGALDECEELDAVIGMGWDELDFAFQDEEFLPRVVILILIRRAFLSTNKQDSRFGIVFSKIGYRLDSFEAQIDSRY